MAWCLVKHRDNFTFLPLPFVYVHCHYLEHEANEMVVKMSVQ